MFMHNHDKFPQCFFGRCEHIFWKPPTLRLIDFNLQWLYLYTVVFQLILAKPGGGGVPLRAVVCNLGYAKTFYIKPNETQERLKLEPALFLALT
jgi:hypothetical protein